MSGNSNFKQEAPVVAACPSTNIPSKRNYESISNLSTASVIYGSETSHHSSERSMNNNIPLHRAKKKSINKKKERAAEDDIPLVSFIALYRYANAWERFLLIIGTINGILAGAATPANNLIFGRIVDKFILYGKSQTSSESTIVAITTEKFLEEIAWLCIWNAGFGFVTFLCNYIMNFCFNTVSENVVFRIRCKFMESQLKQDIGWYDTNETGDFASRITGDLIKIQDGTGEKVGICIRFISAGLLCLGTGFYYGWKLASITILMTPLSFVASAFLAKIQALVSRVAMQSYGKAGAVAEEVLSSIRTVWAFRGERKEIERYVKCLIPAMKKGIQRGLMTGIGGGVTWQSIFCGYALAFYYGGYFILKGLGQENPEYTGGTVVTVFFNVMTASMCFGQTTPYFEAFAMARGAAAKIYSVLEREPTIDSSSEEGLKPSLTGVISLKNVSFSYPSRPTVRILDDMCLDVKPGQTVALVGSSGCGKSTIIQLILRFYDTECGKVEIDGNDVKDLNVGWLRDHIGLVGQEPVLFSTTIAENIRYGKLDATQEEIEAAAKLANAYSFINTLPKKFDTLVGERGAQLSGGQKQRIAIARALIKNPKILLLDEATSALDTESEAVVQAALNKAREGRTTIVVAHRLSTIKSADKIIVLSEGKVMESGTHEELMKRKELYYQLVVTQTKTEEDKDQEEDMLEIENRMHENNSGTDESLPNVQRRQSSLNTHRSAGLERESFAVCNFGRQVSVHSLGNESSVKEEDQEIEKSAISLFRLLKMSASEWPYILIGAISSVLMGLHFPAFGVIFGKILGVLSGPAEKIQEETNFYCLMFVAMGFSSALFTFLQVFMFSIAGEKLTCRLRKLVFAKIITQDMKFFDNPENSVGALCSRLTSDASNVQGVTGSRISTLFQATSTFVACVVLALYYNVKIGLIALSFVPLALLGSYFNGRVVTIQQIREKAGTESASKVAIEAIQNIRTVASLHQEKYFYSQFRNSLLQPHKISRRMFHVRAICYAFVHSLQSFLYATILYYGSTLVADNELLYADLLKVLQGVLLGTVMMGQAIEMAPDYQKSKISAERIFRMLDMKPDIDSLASSGKDLNDVNGNVNFQNVHFNYPSRPKTKILRGLDLEIPPGKTIALVGSSGSGKSTCMQLIERFYDPLKGQVMLDSENVKDVKVSDLRSHIGLVSQEPVLFSYSIAENIAYGDNFRKVDMHEIIDAARQANIHTFIASLPQGYDTPVGNKGTQLSGGQKQRIAIARALLRNPKILLLDEATSALDAESEKAVQEALDRASSGRTCLIIAHRLSTIQNADCIMVIHKGKVVEKGTHHELLSLKGHYYNLHNTQSSAHSE